MNHSKKRKEITALIDNIKVHSDRLTENENIPILELSVILSKINRLKEKTVILKYLFSEDLGSERLGKMVDEDDDDETIEETVQKEENEQSEVIEKGEEAIDNIVAAQIDSSEEEADSQLENSKEDSSTIIDSKEKIAETNEEHISVKETTSTEESITEASPSQEKIEIEPETSEALSKMPDLNEQYSGEEDKSLSDQLKKQPIADLLTAIGLNERYLYANELFEGNITAFKDVVKNLNEQDSLADAQQYFNQELMKSYNWDTDNEMVNALYLLVERRYL